MRGGRPAGGRGRISGNPPTFLRGLRGKVDSPPPRVPPPPPLPTPRGGAAGAGGAVRVNQRTPGVREAATRSGQAADKRPLSLAAFVTTLLTPTPKRSPARQGRVAPLPAVKGGAMRGGVRCFPHTTGYPGTQQQSFEDAEEQGPQTWLAPEHPNPDWDLPTSISST